MHGHSLIVQGTVPVVTAAAFLGFMAHSLDLEPPHTRFVIYGPSGSGKTTLASRIARARGIPHIELDELMHHKPGWVDATPEEFRAKVAAALAGSTGGWVIDGNYSVARDLILPHAEVAVWLDLPFTTVYPRLVRRTLRRTIRREQLWGTNYETWRQLFTGDSMLVWGIAYWRTHHRKTRAALAAAPPHVRVVTLRSAHQVRRFLVQLGL